MDADGQECESTRLAERSAAPIVLRRFLAPSDSRLWRILALLRRGVPQHDVEEATGIASWFVAEMGRNVALEADVAAAGERIAEPADDEAMSLLATAKRAGFGDRELAGLAGVATERIREARLAMGMTAGYAMVDTCAAEFAAETPYFYATYAASGSAPEAPPVARPAALVIGSGPVRIGQGIEFDYCAVQAADTLRRLGWSAVMINSNPETVSTDFDASTRLYFEPLDPESVRGVIDAESPDGVVAGGAGEDATASSRRSSSSAARRRSTSPRHWPPAASRSSARTSRRSTRPRIGRASPPCSTGSASPSPRAGWPTASRRRSPSPSASATRSSSGLRSSSAAWPSISAIRRATWPGSSRPPPSSTPTARSASTATSRASKSTWMP